MSSAEWVEAFGSASSADRASRPAEECSRQRERRLLLRHRDGEPEAFRAFVESYKASAYAYIVRSGVPEGDREDVFQEVFIRVHRAAATYDPTRPLHPWVFTIIVNTVRTYLRKNRETRTVGFDGVWEHFLSTRGPDAERALAARESLACVWRELQAMPVRQRDAIWLAAAERLSMKETAEVLGVSVNTVKTWVRRGRARLTEALARQGEE